MMLYNDLVWTVLLGFLLLKTACFLTAQTLSPQLGTDDPNQKTTWYDCKNLIIAGKGWKESESFYDRLPIKAKDMVPSAVWSLSHDSAGMFARFATNSTIIQVRWTLLKTTLAMPHMPATGVSGIDLYSKDPSGKWVFNGNGRPENITNNISFNVVPNLEYILYLPLYNGIKTIEIGIPIGKNISTPNLPLPNQTKPIVFYGTSITQGGCASRPGLAATAIVGRQLDTPVLNLGFSGNGRMEPELAELLAELDPSIYVLDCLANMSSEMVTERVEPFVKILRKTHPDTPIVLVEDANFKGITPTEKGSRLRTIHEKLIKEGVKNLSFLSNANMLGTDYEGTVDGVHPNDIGMMRQANVFIPVLRALLPAIK